MSYQAYIDGEDVADVATNSGWYDFVRWLEKTNSSILNHLAEYGWSDDFDRLAEDLKEAISKNNPTEDQRDVAEGILEVLKNAGDAEVFAVSDGFSEEDEEE